KLFAEPNKPGNVTNFANVRPDGFPESLPAFFDPAPKNLSKPSGGVSPALTWSPSGVKGSQPNNFNFPVLVDTFTDALPILYYRRTPGVDKPSGLTTVVSD